MENKERENGRKAVHPFQRLQHELAQLIASAVPGAKLPAEPKLARQMRVSRATLREAMRSFEGQGVIRRRQGVGTFVVGRSPVIETGLEVLESIESLSHRIGLEVSMGDLHITVAQASDDEAEALGVTPHSKLVQVKRVIHAGDRPVAFLVDTLPEDVLMPEDMMHG
ncbi:MAG: GntR family transcriptional regulator, partial [Anaerolineaceae bacterium]|nr:GntR family transcriptional regulator [Anaerolineaceae bacterium]